MKQEPVAWTNKKQLEKVTVKYDPVFAWKNKYENTDIPLYTEPQYRELNDEEIDELGDDILTIDRDVNGFPMVIGIRAFARAILKKASEK